MTRPDRVLPANRLAVNCSERTRDGHSILLAEVGISNRGKPGVYLWCKSCRKSHLLSLDQIQQVIDRLRQAEEPPDVA